MERSLVPVIILGSRASPTSAEGGEQRPLPSPRSLTSCFYQKLGFFVFSPWEMCAKGGGQTGSAPDPPQDTDGFRMLPRVLTWAPPASLVCKHLLLRGPHGDVQMKSSFKISLEEF